METAATICHTHLNPKASRTTALANQSQGKVQFIQKLQELVVAQVRTISVDAITKFLNREMAARDTEIEEDDTSGREIRHGSYFTHLDELRERFKYCRDEELANKGKRKKVLTPQQTAKVAAKNSLQQSYAARVSAMPTIVSDDSSEASEAAGDVELSDEDEERGQSVAVSQSDRSVSSRSNSTQQSIRKKQKLTTDLGVMAMAKSIKRLARATEEGAANLAEAARGGGRDNVRKLIAESQSELNSRLQAFETKVAKQYKGLDNKFNSIIAAIASMKQQQ